MERDELQRIIDSDLDGLLIRVNASPALSAADRLLAGFDEITAFVREHGREPRRDAANMTETSLAMRLQALRDDAASRELLADVDEVRLLEEPAPPTTLEEVFAADVDALLDGEVPGLLAPTTSKPQTMPERIARRRPSADFVRFEPLFAQCHADLRAGERRLMPFRKPSEIEPGRFFVQSGVLLYVDHVGARTADSIGKSNARTRCIFENGTESDLLLQSLASNLYKDGKRVTEPGAGTLPRMGLEPGTPTATVYVLRSLSADPQLQRFPDVHKIGSTRQSVEARVANAVAETTFLGAAVKVVATYEVPQGAEKDVERLLHRMLEPVRLDAWFDQGERIVDVTEWFAVSLDAVDEAITLIENETASSYRYDPQRGRFALRVA